MPKRNAIRDWLNGEAWALPRTDDYSGIRRLAALMQEEGIPIRRMRVATRVLHPLFKALSLTWNADGDRVEELEIPHEWEDDDPRFVHTPLYTIFLEGAHAVRRRRGDPICRNTIPDPMEAGMTDFAVFRMEFRRLPHPDGAFSIATDAPQGFSKRNLELVDEFIAPLAHLAEVFFFEEMTKTLLQTYLGKTPGERVMNGQIRRGDVIDIRAVIWFADLRESTRLSATLPRRDYLALLNRYFDCVAGAVLDHGGEVLRYIGDAALAIFPAATEGAETRDACVRAVAAAEEARARLAQLNAERALAQQGPVDFGIGLHVGEVTYGNVGVPERLEFTVIGEAANRAARLQDQSKRLNCPLVVSEEFAREHGGRWERLGFMNTRDLAGGAAVFGPVA